jgi:hypothetical protein
MAHKKPDFDPPQTWYRACGWRGEVIEIPGVVRVTPGSVIAVGKHGGRDVHKRDVAEIFPDRRDAQARLVELLVDDVTHHREQLDVARTDLREAEERLATARADLRATT